MRMLRMRWRLYQWSFFMVAMLLAGYSVYRAVTFGESEMWLFAWLSLVVGLWAVKDFSRRIL